MKQKEQIIKNKSNVPQEHIHSCVEETPELEAQVPSWISLQFSVTTSPEASAALPIAHKLKQQDMATNGLQCYIPHQLKRKNKQTNWSKGRNGIGPAHAMCLHLDQSIICWQGAVFYSIYMAVPMGKPEDGEGGYFIEERRLLQEKSFVTDKIICVNCNNIWKIAITTPSPEYIHIYMNLLSICRILYFLKVIFLKSQINTALCVNYDEYRSSNVENQRTQMLWTINVLSAQ